MFSFDNPWFLSGLFTISIPIYLHLYYRKNPIPRDFPSLRLIRLSMQALVRRMQLKNLLLLLLRILVLLFLTAALAKPFWGGSTGGARSEDPAAFVIALDNSLSMGVTFQGISLFNSAKAKALEILDKMGPYDKASVAMVNDPGSLLFPQLTWDKNELKEAVRNAPLTMSGTNLFSSLQPAIKLLTQVRSYKRTLYLITDVTAAPWKTFLESYDPRGIDKNIDLVLIPIGSPVPYNLTLESLSLGAPIVLKGRTIGIWATVFNHSAQGQKTRISLIVDGDKKDEKSVELKPQEKKRIMFSCVFPTEGTSHVRATLSGDYLPQDDTRHLAVKVFAPQKALIVKPPPDRQGKDTREDIFLKFALNPMLRRDGATFNVDTRSSEEVNQIDLSGYAVVFFINQRNVPQEFIPRLSQYVMSGGNLIVFMGSRIDPSWYNLQLIDKLGTNYLMPARLLKRIGNAVSKSVAYQLTDLDFGHPAFKLFVNEGNGDPGRAQIYEYYQMEGSPTAMAIARMSHGLPAIVEEKRGQGRVLLVSLTADTEWSNWPLKTTFLPFIHQTVLGMIGKQGFPADSILPGTPVSMVLREEGLKRVVLSSPKGTKIELPLSREKGGFLHFSTTETEDTGFYQMVFERVAPKHSPGAPQGEGAGKTTTEAFAVNFPPEEGYLERIDPTKIPRFIPIAQQPGSKQSLGDKITLAREGRELAIPFLWALLLIAFAETLLANVPLAKLGKQ